MTTLGSRRAEIILIEDNAPDVFLIKQALEARSIDYNLTRFEDGDEALAALAFIAEGPANPPDLILLDLNLPRFDGLDILRTIRSKPRLAGVPIAILTSSQSPSDKLRASTFGVVRYIMKPFLLEDFLEQVGGEIADLLSSGRDGSAR